jgi:triphosphoribosyl-dephospho-CoA synthase
VTAPGQDTPRRPPLTDDVRAAFERACLIEIESLKPGNVHQYAEGHGMTAGDFRESAWVAADAIVQPEISVGLRIASAVTATVEAVGCNTNLGIVLLAAPLVHAALSFDKASEANEARFRLRLLSVLGTLTVSDADFAFAAIRHANPAGLGAARRHDVTRPAQATLLQAMQEAAPRDRIALQYANGFADVFSTGVPELRAGLERFKGRSGTWAWAWAATGTFLNFLSRFPDSHILRKHSAKAAEAVRAEAAKHYKAFAEQADPEAMKEPLLAFDSALKRKDLNPGTSADLTVAALLAVGLLDIVGPRTAGRKGGLAP